MELKRRQRSFGRQLRGGVRQENCRFRSAKFLCLAFLPCFLSIAIAPLATGLKASPAFIAAKSRGIGNYFTSSRTRMFYQQQNFENQEPRNNVTDMAMSTRRSSGSATELPAFSSSLDFYEASDGIIETENGENWNGSPKQSYKIYCDMDGCLVNFEKGVRTLLKRGSSDLEKRTMWEGISRAPRWFEQLEWQMDGRRLWNAIKHLNPDILTGVPEIKSSRVEKFNWCKRELGLEEADAHHVDMAAYGVDGLDDHQSVNGNFPREDKTNIITCWSNHKYKECNRHGSILIDDRIDLKDNWEAAGGIFIHHVNTESTIRKLCELGVITEDQIANGEDDWYWEGSWKMWKNDRDGNTETTIHKLCEIGVMSEGQIASGEDDWYHFIW